MTGVLIFLGTLLGLAGAGGAGYSLWSVHGKLRDVQGKLAGLVGGKGLDLSKLGGLLKQLEGVSLMTPALKQKLIADLLQQLLADVPAESPPPPSPP